MSSRSSPPPPSPRRTPAPPSPHAIFFPSVYENAWSSAGGLGPLPPTDLDRARIFLLRFTNMSSDSFVNNALRAIAMDKAHNSVPAIACAVMWQVFRGRHASFQTSPAMQCVRFILIKSRVQESMFSDRAREVCDFFFDPTIARNLDTLPLAAVEYQCPSARLKVVIVGGGPTALASAICLAEKGEGKVEVHVYEKRWTKKVDEQGRTYFGYPETTRRRDQVVTLQDTVTRLLTRRTYEALFENRPERVWPGSANIQIRKVEDRLLGRAQEDDLKPLIHLHAQNVSLDDLPSLGNFHVLLGADGAASWVRKSYFHGYEVERGKSYALGLAFDRPEGLPWSQPLNVFLTLGQTRYLLNASDYDGRGYLNMQLTEEEWEKMVCVDGQPCHFGRPACLRVDGKIPPGFDETQVFAPSEYPESPLWKSIEDGLKLFGFKESEVINIVRIPIVVQAVREGVQYLAPTPSSPLSINRPHALVAVAGDAAMTVHFWPGRGLNSGIKSGIALADELVHSLNSGHFVGLSLDALKPYNDFIIKLQAREHDKRSMPILNQSGDPDMLNWLISKAHTVPDNVAIGWLVGAMTQIAQRLETRPDWPFPVVENVEPQLRIILRQLYPVTLKEMAVSFPWPTREMAGAEVLPIRSMTTEEKQKWVHQIWSLLGSSRGRDRERSRSRDPSPVNAPSSNGRFEASVPKHRISRTPSPAGFGQSLTVPGSTAAPRPSSAQSDSGGLPLQRSNASRSGRSPSPSRFDQNLTVPGERSRRSVEIPRGSMDEGRPTSSGGEVSLGRIVSTGNRPTGTALANALSLALFRVESSG